MIISEKLPTYSVLYKVINKEFIKFLEKYRTKLNECNPDYLSGYKPKENQSLDDINKIFIINFFLHYVQTNKNILLFRNKSIYDSQSQKTYEDVLENCISLLTKEDNIAKIERNDIDEVFNIITDHDENIPSNWKDLVNTVKNDIINELEPKEKGGKKSRKRKHNKLKKKRKSTRKKRRKSNKKHR